MQRFSIVTNWIPVSVFAMAVVTFTTASVSALEADKTEWARNCIDSCIVEFVTQAGHPVTFDDVDRAIASSGLDQTTAYRSLADCMKLLELLGVPVTAQYITVNKQTVYPPLAIAYVPPAENRRTGHVIVLSNADNGSLQIYDPAAKTPHFKILAADVHHSLDTVILVPQSHARQAAFMRVLTILGPVTLIGLFMALGLRRYSQKNKSRGSPAPLTTALLMLAVTSPGCGTSSPDVESGISVDQEMYDHGVINPVPAGNLISHNFVVTNKSSTPVVMSVRASCSCVVSAIKDSPAEILPGVSVTLPVAINLSAKVGAFREIVQLRFENSKIPNRSLEIRVRINNHEAATLIKVVSPDQVRCEILHEPDRLSVSLQPDQVGKFRFPISFWLNDGEVATLELFGTAKDQ